MIKVFLFTKALKTMKYPNPSDLSNFKLKLYLKELIEFRVKMKLELSVINYEKFLPEIKVSDDQKMEQLNRIICEYIEELVYKRGKPF